MHRYLIRFTKSGLIRYTSHLDMVRLFHRTFKRIGISLSYSKGFSPHPKMSFAQPLSLGYTSIGEYLEIETEEPYMANKFIDDLNNAMPEGIKITKIQDIRANRKSIASLVSYASYEITCVGKLQPSHQLIKTFMEQESIIIQRKRKGKERRIDIRPLIHELEILKMEENKIIIFALINTGSSANLNPGLLMAAIGTHEQADYDHSEADFKIKRLEMFNEKFKPIYSIV